MSLAAVPALLLLYVLVLVLAPFTSSIADLTKARTARSSVTFSANRRELAVFRRANRDGVGAVHLSGHALPQLHTARRRAARASRRVESGVGNGEFESFMISESRCRFKVRFVSGLNKKRSTQYPCAFQAIFGLQAAPDKRKPFCQSYWENAPYPFIPVKPLMPLPTPQPRSHLHTRSVVYSGYHREDGLWDIEAKMSDVKTYALDRSERGVMPPGTPLHGMAIRVTVDDAMTILEIASAMDHTPFGECQQGMEPMQKMVGATMGPGWRQAIEQALGGIRGCTHLRELLFNMATAAYQTIPAYRERLRRQAGLSQPESTEPPYHLGKCIAWDFGGPVVLRHYPTFAGWQPLKRVGKADSHQG